MSKKEQEKVLLRASAIDGDMTEYHFSIEFYIFREGESYIAYCPSLDISTCAETYNDAISSFYEAFQLYIECCAESGSLHDDLAEHGWKFQKNSKPLVSANRTSSLSWKACNTSIIEQSLDKISKVVLLQLICDMSRIS